MSRGLVADPYAAALRLHQAGRLDEAERAYRAILKGDAGHAETLHSLGVVAFQTGRNEEAENLIARAIERNGAVAAYHINLGNAFQAQRKWDEAVVCYRRSLAIEPHRAGTFFNLGVVFQAQAKWHEAATSYARALALNPGDAEAHSNLGNVLQAQGKTREAVECYKRALSLKPTFAEAHHNFGVALDSLGQFAHAATAYRHALIHRPDYFEARYNLGVALQALGQHDEAIAIYRRVLAQNPGFAEAHYNLGVVFQAQGLLDAAMASYRRAVAAKSEHAGAHSNILMLQHYLAECSNAERLAEARRFGASFDRPMPRPAPRDPRPDRRLRIGYVSGDLRFHPVGYFLDKVFAAHDASAVEIYCYANTVTSDAMTDRLRAASHQWRVIAGLPDEAVVAQIRDDGIDILIDLAGHTDMNRLLMFALRPAPVQVSWLGYFGTAGLGAIDYTLMDKASVPPGDERWFREAIARLPYGRFCYQPHAEAPEPAAPPVCRRGYVMFGSFNNIAKIGPDVVQLWARVLDAVPRSRLLLKWTSLGEARARHRLVEAFAAAGIAEDRLELRGKSPHREMLGEYGDMDLALDPFPFGGGITSCDALWMGVPVLTLPGDRPASRQTLGFLQSLGLDDLVAASPDDYVAKAAQWAGDADRLAELRRTLRPRMAAAPLCDGPLFTRALEAALREMWRRCCGGEAPETFEGA